MKKRQRTVLITNDVTIKCLNVLQKFIVFYGVRRSLNKIFPSKMKCILEKHCKVLEQHFK